MHKKIYVSLFFFFLSSFAGASENLEAIEMNCWNKAVDEGSLLCMYVMPMGVVHEGNRIRREIPEVAALDKGGPKTEEQGHRICRAMGFSYGKNLILAHSAKEQLLVVLNEDLQTGELQLSKGDFIQQLNCL